MQKRHTNTFCYATKHPCGGANYHCILHWRENGQNTIHPLRGKGYGNTFCRRTHLCCCNSMEQLRGFNPAMQRNNICFQITKMLRSFHFTAFLCLRLCLVFGEIFVVFSAHSAAETDIFRRTYSYLLLCHGNIKRFFT